MVGAVAAWLVRAALRVSEGNGAETYYTVYGMQVHWVSALSFLGALLVALLLALILRWWQRRDDRRIEQLLAQTQRTRDKHPRWRKKAGRNSSTSHSP
jgi:hypothetical protein